MSPATDRSEGPATQALRFARFNDDLTRGFHELAALPGADLFKFILQFLEQAWTDDVEAQKAHRSVPSQLAAKYADLSERVARGSLLLAWLKRRCSGRDLEEVEEAARLAASWLAALQKPAAWTDAVLLAHSGAGFLDRVAARLEIARGGGIDVGR
jgi:hypothetical protein